MYRIISSLSVISFQFLVASTAMSAQYRGLRYMHMSRTVFWFYLFVLDFCILKITWYKHCATTVFAKIVVVDADGGA